MKKVIFKRQKSWGIIEVIRNSDWTYTVKYRGNDGLLFINDYVTIGQAVKCNKREIIK